MTKLEMLQDINNILSEDCSLSLDDFFSVTSRDGVVTLSFTSRNQPKFSMSNVILGIKKLKSFSFIKDFSCGWNEEMNWYDIGFDVDGKNTDLDKYSVEITLH